MTVIYPVDVQVARMLEVRTGIDAGGAAGRLEICTADYATIIATITLGYSGNSTGTMSGTTLTLAGFPRSDTSADNSGLAAVARIRTSAGVDVVTGMTVGTEGTDVVVPNLNFTQGQLVTITSVTLTHFAMAPNTYPVGVDPTSTPPVTDGSLTAFATAIGLAAAPANTWIDTGIMPDGAWALRSMIEGARDATQAEVEPGPADVGNFSATAFDTLVNSNGAAWFPTKKQFFWAGGGHGGWPGNEVYWMDVPTRAWGRLTDPSPMARWPEGPSGWGWQTLDGSMISNHTYNGIAAVEALDAFFVMFGSPWPDGNFPNSDLWKFHIPTKTWTLVAPDVMLPTTYGRGKEVHWVESQQKLALGIPNYWRWFDPFTNVAGPVLRSQSTMSNGNSVNTPTGVYTFGNNGSCFFVSHAAIGVSAPTSMNASVIPRIRGHARWLDAGHQWNSFFWDTTRNMVIAWSGSYTSEPTTNRTDVGKFVYAIDFANDHLYEFVVPSGTWARSRSLGSFTKWQHLVEIDAYIGMNHTAETQGWMVFKPGNMTLLA
jgi:hypothetical protein